MEFRAPQALHLHSGLKQEVHRFDGGHRELSDLANQVIQAIWSGQPKDVIMASIDVLFGSTSRHFYEVERLMNLIGFPDLPKHEEYHNRLARKLARFSAECRLAPIDADWAEQFLEDWLHEHILQSDLCSLSTQGQLPS